MFTAHLCILILHYCYRIIQRYPIIIEQFLEDNVLESFNMVYKAEDGILDQTCRRQICLDISYDDF